MHFVSIRELSRSPSRWVDLAVEGECVIITRNGKPAAVLAEMSEGDVEDFVIARHLDLAAEMDKAHRERERGTTLSAEALLERLGTEP